MIVRRPLDLRRILRSAMSANEWSKDIFTTQRRSACWGNWVLAVRGLPKLFGYYFLKILVFASFPSHLQFVCGFQKFGRRGNSSFPIPHPSSPKIPSIHCVYTRSFLFLLRSSHRPVSQEIYWALWPSSLLFKHCLLLNFAGKWVFITISFPTLLVIPVFFFLHSFVQRTLLWKFECSKTSNHN